MPSEEQTTKTTERCAEHPGRRAVGACEACGRPLCVACAVPVRGRVVGVECVASVLGEQQQPDGGRSWRRSELAVGVGLAAVVIASILPWTRFGVGSALLGGWDAVPSWSLLASAAGTAALVAWSALERRRRRGGDGVALAGGIVAAAAAFLAYIHPPPFTKPWVGPVVAFLGGVATVVAVVGETRRSRRVG